VAEPLSPSDLSAIQAERGPVNMAVGGVVVVDGHVERDTIVERIRRRLDLIPRYRMRLQDVAPLGLAYPVWEEAPDFDPADHVERVGVPAPGGDAELCELVGDVMSTRLDRRRPLWRMVVAQGLAGGRTAIIAAMHHALVDGVAAVNVGILILDAGDGDSPTAARREEPARRSALVEQLAGRAVAQLALPRRLVRGTVSRALALDPVDAARQARSAAAVLRELAASRSAAPATPLNVPIGRRRSFALARARLDVVKAVKNATGTTVNDVLLTAVSLMLGDYLGPAAPEVAVALGPVSVRPEARRGELGNHISTVFVDLPLRGDPLTRLRAVSRQMDHIKGSAQVQAGALLVGATGLAPPFISSLAVRAMSGPRLFNLVVSNVPGPQSTLYLDGKPVREIFPAVPLNPRNQALTIGMLSYDGGVDVGLLGDRRALGDLRDAAAGLEAAVDTLARLA
jgi:WS/DGAT/MGAT family acyltransferase